MRKTLVQDHTEELKSAYENFHKKLTAVCSQYIVKEESKDSKQKPNYKAGILFSGLTSGAKEEAKKLMAISCKLVEGSFEQSVRSLGQYYTNLKGVVTRLSKDLESSKGTQKFLIQIVDVLLEFGEFASQFSSDCLRDLATLEASQVGTHKNAEKLAEKNQELEMSLNQTNTTIMNLNQSIVELRDQVNRSQVHSRVNEASSRASRSTLNVSIFGNGAARSMPASKGDPKNENRSEKDLKTVMAVLNPSRFKAFQTLRDFSEENSIKHAEMQEFARSNNLELLESDFMRDIALVRTVMKEVLKDYKCEKTFAEIVKIIQPKNESLLSLHVRLLKISSDKENSNLIDTSSKFVKAKIEASKESEIPTLVYQMIKTDTHGFFERDETLLEAFRAQATHFKKMEAASDAQAKSAVKVGL